MPLTLKKKHQFVARSDNVLRSLEILEQIEDDPAAHRLVEQVHDHLEREIQRYQDLFVQSGLEPHPTKAGALYIHTISRHAQLEALIKDYYAQTKGDANTRNRLLYQAHRQIKRLGGRLLDLRNRALRGASPNQPPRVRYTA
ncbi:hypothetical protein RM531_08525 [Salinisphaera sp. P385]|uniref:Uncharacterized protein n=1 Tax=Spectribacter acetivorans TaxID=3075603 RepID=A0ABU3B7U0_9GAMM|nr:hypothetical protein [Salinisphaera sp. P385]MDT0618521.1 hypothetical protein [Salinisphaera sp. P385]